MNRFLVYAALILFLGGCAGNTEQRALKRGMRALEKGNYTESISWFQISLAGIASNEQRSIVLNCMGISYYKLGQKKDAWRSLEAAGAANPNAVEPIYNLGVVAFEEGDEDKAIACFEKAALLSGQTGPGLPRDTRALEFLAMTHSRRQQWDDARRVLNEASQNTRLSPRILATLAVIEVKANNPNRAQELLQEALEQDAHYAPAIYNLAVINQHYLRRQDQALPLFNEYARLVPSGPQTDQARLIIEEMKNSRPSPPPAATNAGIKAPLAVVKATVTVENAKTPTVPTQPTVAAAPPPTFPSFDELMQVAKKLEQQGRREAAFNNYLRIARAAEQAGKTSVKNQAIRHAVALADGNPQAAYDLGVYFAERDKKDEALVYFKAAVNQTISPHPASMALAKLAIEKGEFDTAIVSLKKADQIKPADPEALWLLAELYDRQLCISNSAASTYAQFTTRFPNDRRAPDALNRLKTLNPDFRPPEKTPPGKNVNSRSLLQRFFKSSAKSRQEKDQ